MAAHTAFVIVGAGLAGAKAVQTLREEGFSGPVVLLGEESECPYERPPLSKGYLWSKDERDTVYVHPPEWYADHDVDLCRGTRVTAIDPAAHEVALADGGRVGYAKLLLTTGSSPRRLPVSGADLGGVLYLCRLDDSDRIKESFASVSRIAVIGAGSIGLETADAARAVGVEGTVLETGELPLLRILGREVAQILANLHSEHGVDLRCGVQGAEITGDGG
ncbi:NAD(P)/FAD-dependent oxidoreductase [Streptomyces sp. NPDC059441]|uniref:NAD(P)/FAD-dependent oxidoreductase n=1 Tax=Streptomyces sp. NPDC059441 TaxID=3346829 RepID=UPI0036C2FFD3